MEICSLPLTAAVLIKTNTINDQRGAFARLFCSNALSSVIGTRRIVNVNHSCTCRAGIVRGLHFQHPPHREMKFVRCLNGAIYDVIVDIRSNSATYLHWHAEILNSTNRHMLFVPEGFAHGFQALEDNSEVLYFTTACYAPDHEGGMRYDDPAIAIDWPMAVTGISEKDASHPLIATDKKHSAVQYAYDFS